MTLQKFLETLQTKGTMVTLFDVDTDAEMMNFKAEGYENLDDAIEAMEVKRWSFSMSSLQIWIGA